MNQLQYWLAKLAEEGAEIAQIALKTTQFGPSEVMPGQPLNNFERCHRELDDLWAVVEVLNDQYAFGYAPDRARIDAKKRKVREYLGYSIHLGLVSGVTNVHAHPMARSVPAAPPSSRAGILAMARQDYDDSLVKIAGDIIETTAWPLHDLQPMAITLNGAVASRPSSAMAFLLLMTAVNYRFWRLDGKEVTRYRCLGETGARALWAAFEGAWGFADASADSFSARLEAEGVEGLFGDIPEPLSRRDILHEVLRGDLPGVAAATVDAIAAGRSITVAHAAALASAFPLAFGDPYLKKAQLALAMYAAYLRANGDDVDTSDLTAFADYQVPRVLRALGVLCYRDTLAAKVDAGEPIAPDSTEERAIRAATVLACEGIAEHCNATAAQVDNWLWASQDQADGTRFHLTPTTRY